MMKPRWIRILLLATIPFFVSIRAAWSDHLPPSEIAEGKPEHILAGVDVYGDKIEAVLRRLGKPKDINSSTNPDYPPGSGERSYTWDSDGVRVRVATEFRTDEKSKKLIESAPMFVDVWGIKGDQKGRTGRGLALGDGVATVRKIYGARYQQDAHSITLQWKDETTLVLDLDDRRRVVHMQLLAATE